MWWWWWISRLSMNKNKYFYSVCLCDCSVVAVRALCYYARHSRCNSSAVKELPLPEPTDTHRRCWHPPTPADTRRRPSTPAAWESTYCYSCNWCSSRILITLCIEITLRSWKNNINDVACSFWKLFDSMLLRKSKTCVYSETLLVVATLWKSAASRNLIEYCKYGYLAW